MIAKKSSLSESYKLISGIWDSDNFSFIFNGEVIGNGTVSVFNKKTKMPFGFNFRIVQKDSITKLQFINKDEPNSYFEEFPIFSLNEHRLTIQNREVAITVNKVV